MPELLIPEIPAELHQRLVDSANRHQRTLEGEALTLLDDALRRGIDNGDTEYPPSWYNPDMEPVASKRAAQTKKRKTEKHIAPPASLEEISRGLGVTRKDKAIVRKVLTELGYIGKKSARTKAASKEPARSRRG
jgi:hypothetical protein